MTSDIISDATIGTNRADEIHHELKQLARFERRLKAARRRFRMRAFLAWREMADARQRRNGHRHSI
jgi:hypothetical protein